MEYEPFMENFSIDELDSAKFDFDDPTSAM